MQMPERMLALFGCPPRALTRSVSAALTLALTCEPVAAAVFNCADSGTGSLRDAVSSAASGAVIDMSQLQCSTISLTTGAIAIGVDSLTLIGPATGLTVNGHSTLPYSPVFVHSGTGTLTISHVTLQHGVTTSAHGGCLSSNGNIVLDHAGVNHCSTYYPSPLTCPALGGGVYAKGNLTLLYSTIANNGVSCYSNSIKVKAYGGGAFAGGDMTVRGSTIADNYAGTSKLSSFTYAYGAGLALRGNLEISDSTIARNHAGVTDCFYSTFGTAGGIDVPNALSNVTITNSTISANTATVFVGGVFTTGPLTLSNSTVAFNSTSAGGITLHGHDYAPGIHVQNTSADLQSSIVANNTFDSCSSGFLTDLTGLNATITGSNNLVMGSTVAPAGSLTADPQLLPLADNGGPTWTHKPGPASPAIDHGNDKAGLAQDQRGPGFARIFGGVADIGAFETGDGILIAGFEPPG